jgi:predicted DNA-binding protein YlxM (UPF0122 family)
MGEIAQRLGVSKTTVHKLIKRHGMPMLVPTENLVPAGTGAAMR